MSASRAPNGLLLFTRYSFRPNALGYCGGQHARGLFEACVTGDAAPELRGWATQFEGAYPYFQLIARVNGIPDPLDYRVIEAYWLGNELLKRVSMASLYDSLRERFAPRLSAKTLELVLGKVPAGAEPFHAFHVLDVCRRTGSLAENLQTLDNCRICWGRVLSAHDGHLNVAAQPVVFENGKLALGAETTRTIQRQIDGRGFVDEAKPGDWVSIHWGWACDVLDERRLANVRYHTRRHLAIANLTM